MKMQTQDIRQLVEWLAATDIDSLELRSPDVQLRIQRDGTVTAGADESDIAPEATPAAADAVTVRAPSLGLLLDRIPGRNTPLCPPGSAIQKGSLLALLQIGTLLLPVNAPCDGWAAEWQVEPGSRVGYGTALLDIYTEPAEVSS